MVLQGLSRASLVYTNTSPSPTQGTHLGHTWDLSPGQSLALGGCGWQQQLHTASPFPSLPL